MRTNKFDYFDAFVEFTEKAHSAAMLLDRFLSAYDPDAIELQMDQIHEIEHDADTLRHTVIEHLSREFVAPIEREDIMSLVQEFDNVVDGIDDVMRKLTMYKVRELRPDVRALTALLVAGCQSLCVLTREFASFKKSRVIREKIIAVNTVESEADTLHFSAVSKLFCSDESPKTLLVWQRVYDALEDCFDNCEHASEIIESVILKNT